ncbi:hypothetical protein PRUPE_1G581400 [Prunus persica]|uniref:Uncharacterized protein n=1 Tax=Prunus persica TaxID=3760 RepID=A0A251RK17_PRUPE|nr:hypothetical protein PRUPE_1G581400 [Prunus persica]
MHVTFLVHVHKDTGKIHVFRSQRQTNQIISMFLNFENIIQTEYSKSNTRDRNGPMTISVGAAKPGLCGSPNTTECLSVMTITKH